MPPRSPRPTTVRTPRTPKADPVLSVPEAPAPLKSKRWLSPVVMVLVALLLIALSVAGYFYYQFKNTSQAADQKEIESLSEEIGKIMLLPEGETPTLATVTDREKLADQPFFQRAENGDKVLIYSNSGRAILYRPSQGKIVDITTVNLNTPAAEAEPATPSPEAAPAIVRVALLNGSTRVGVTNQAESQLKNVLPNAAVVTKANAKKRDYTSNTVVLINSAAGEAATQIAQALGGSVGQLPEGEEAPTDADILVIMGSAPEASEGETN